MASSTKFVDFILEQLKDVGEVYTKKMFGEYCLYANNKVLGLICENQLFIKPTKAGRDFLGENALQAPAYKGAKPSFLIENIDNEQWLCELARLSLEELPELKKRKKSGK